MDHATDVVIRHGKDKKVVACSVDLHDANPEATVITVEEFDNYEEATDFFNEVGEDGEVTTDGVGETLELINSAHRANCMNKARASFARPKSAFTQLRQKAQTDPAARAMVEKLLEELEIEGVDI